MDATLNWRQIHRPGVQGGRPADLFRRRAVPGVRHLAATVLSAQSRRAVGPKGEKTPLELHKNYRPLSWSRTGDFSFPLVFVGYGITAPQQGFDEYAGVDVAGKAVIVLRNEPQQDDPASLFEGARQSEHAFVVRKIANALEHGAEESSLTESRTVAKRTSQTTAGRRPVEADPLLNFTTRGKRPAEPIVVLHCRRSVVEAVIQAARGVSLGELERRVDENLKPQSCELTGWRMVGHVSMKNQRRSLKNVAASRDGEGKLAQEAIVVGAHYDHLGSGGITSLAPWTASIHHGGRQRLRRGSARRSRAPTGPNPCPRLRQLLFIAWTAEEAGLVGGEEYCSRPLMPLKSARVLNLDMVGAHAAALMVFRRRRPGRSPLVNRLSSAYDLTPRLRSGGFARAIMFRSTAACRASFLHRIARRLPSPNRHADKLNYEGMRKITGLVADLVGELSTTTRLEANRRAFEDLTIEPTPPAARTAYLGVASVAAQRGPGYAVAAVQPGSPAARSGLRAGDVILKWDGEEVRQPADLVALGATKSRRIVSR